MRQGKRLPGRLLFILLLSVGLRTGAALYMGNQVVPLPGTADQVSYHALALRVIDGHGFTFEENWWPLTRAGEPTAHWSYLYVLLLSGVYKLVGVQPVLVRLAQAALVGIAQPLLAYHLGVELFGKRSGLVAALMTALYGYFIYYSGTLMTEPLFFCIVLLALYLFVRVMRGWPVQPGRQWQVGLTLGLTLGAGVLLRQLLLLIVPVMLVWAWWATDWRSTRIVLTSAFVLTVMIAPFTIFNSTRFDDFVLLNTNAGFAFFWANHPVYDTQFVPILTEEMGTYADLIPEELRGLDEAALDRALLRLGAGFVLNDPIRYMWLCLSRIPVYFKFWPSMDSSILSNLVRVMSFGISLPFMALGVIRALRWKGAQYRGTFRTGVGLLLAFAMAYTFLHLLSWSLIRYRLPIDAILVVFAGSALVWLYDAFIARWANPSDLAPVVFEQISQGTR